MKLYTIWKQYPQSYPGELFPDCENAVTEFVNDDNPSWLEDKIEDAKQEVASGDISSYRVIVIELSEDKIHEAFDATLIEGDIE